MEKQPDLAPCVPDIQAAFKALDYCFARGGKVLICGNGGSAADSEHIVGELMKGYLLPRILPATVQQKLITAWPQNGSYLAHHLQGALPAISLVSQTALLTAYANDVAADMAFAQQVYGYGREGDVVLGISTSGHSRNVVYALQVGRALGLRTIGLTGRQGGEMKGVCDVAICVPREPTAEIQQGHMVIYHALCAMLEATFFTEEKLAGVDIHQAK
jgi:D-sedoheptulose 7-phosphate isomerase